MNSSPFEIIAAPFDIWIADAGSAFPEIGEIPDSSLWFKLGKSGTKNQSEDGVTVQGGQSINHFRAVGSTLPRKSFRPEESLIVSFSLADMQLEQLRYAFNKNAVTDTAAVSGTGGYRSLSLKRGLVVTPHALLVRGPSPYGDDLALDFQLPRVVHTGEPEFVFKKDEPAMCLFQFEAQEDDSAEPTLLGQDADAS